jgi:hypothetical protein
MVRDAQWFKELNASRVPGLKGHNGLEGKRTGVQETQE